MKSKNIWQDNKLAEKTDKNGKCSYLCKSRHISIKYFWLYDRLKQVNISIKHFPTDKMLANLFTKPLQDSKFNMFRRVIMRRYNLAMLWDGSKIDGK